MELDPWHLWLIAAIVLLIVEVFTPAFLAGSVAVACAVTAIAATLGVSLEWQFFIFSISLFIVFIGIRPFVRKYIFRNTSDVRTNSDALIGRQARVIEAVDP